MPEASVTSVKVTRAAAAGFGAGGMYEACLMIGFSAGGFGLSQNSTAKPSATAVAVDATTSNHP